jgi:hypothetical protein
MKDLTVFVVLVLTSLNFAHAQQVRKASGRAQFRLEDHMSKEDLKEKLRHQAIINAIEREYGTYVTQESFVDVDDGSMQFRIFGKTTVRGEWLKTTSEHFKEELRKVKGDKKTKHELWMVAKIEGLVRELSQPDIDFSFFTTNCKKAVCQTGIFENGQPIYFHFKTPVDGFLSIYMVENDKAYRLLPYQNMPVKYKNAVPVLADKNYVFFSSSSAHDYFPDFSRYLIDELVMVTESEEEFVELFLVFSTEEFDKPVLSKTEIEESSGYEIPRSLEASSLTNWLEDNRIHSENFYYRNLNLKIVN